MRENGTPQAGKEEINASKKLVDEKGEPGFERMQKETGRNLQAVINAFFALAPCNITNW